MDVCHFYSETPRLIKNRIDDWEILRYTEEDWCNEFEGGQLRFRKGTKEYSETPQWEQTCEVEEMTLTSFFKSSAPQNDSHWLYFDYKYMKDVLSESSKLYEGIKWENLKLGQLTGRDSTLWIGTQGAHTPCHMDTYGCNFVAQVYGRKLWILMPPHETDSLNPVRVPYEESSVYSSHNFYTPGPEVMGVREAYRVVLSPGDVLFVPRHWWHYVENVDTAISVNVWVPLDVDHESRLEESLVRHFVYGVCQDLTLPEAKRILNPNEWDLLNGDDGGTCFAAVQKCLETCLNRRRNLNSRTTDGAGDSDPVATALDSLPIEKCDLASYVEEKSRRHRYSPGSGSGSGGTTSPVDRRSVAEALINSYCHPANIGRVKESLVRGFP